MRNNEMSRAGSQLRGRKPAFLIRILLGINFLFFLLLVSPFGRSRQLYKSIREAGFGALATTGLPLWFGGTTLIVTTLYLWGRIRRWDSVSEHPRKAFDGVLLLAWWIVLIVACIYAFMMGTGG
jgi:hypothetical protein